jgi:hypothetical protein
MNSVMKNKTFDEVLADEELNKTFSEKADELPRKMCMAFLKN